MRSLGLRVLGFRVYGVRVNNLKISTKLLHRAVFLRHVAA